MAAHAASAPFSRAVVASIRRIYPESLADKSFDNTGLLLEAPFEPARRQRNSALLTIDLTKAVADEAIERRDSIVIAYHPIIFRGLKSITLADTQQKSLLRLAAAGISVYSPHTALDAGPGGLGDWLADIVTGSPSTQSAADTKHIPTNDDDPLSSRPTYQLQHQASQLSLDSLLHDHVVPHSRGPIIESSNMGRLVRFSKPQTLSSIIARIAKALGNPAGFPLAIPQGASVNSLSIRSVGICAGSGAGVFAALAPDDGDLLLTGELGHHETLAAIERGKSVIALFHSNSERGFLPVLKAQLEKTVAGEWTALRAREREGCADKAMLAALDDGTLEIAISERDRDPYGVMINKDV